MDHYFLSYSRVDGGNFALRLANKLAAGPPPYSVWVDRRELRPGEDWDEQIVEAIRTCRGLLFVITKDSVQPESGCKPEWVRALKYKKPIVPLRLDHDAELPFRLGSRQFIDFSGSFEAGLARLRDHLEWMGTPQGALQELRHRLADAERELRRVGPDQQARIEQEVQDLRWRISEQQRLILDPDAASDRTRRRIAANMERERQPQQPVAAAKTRFVNPPPMTAPPHFQDRQVETSLIGEFLRLDGLRLMTVVGRAGVGKTAIVCRLLKTLEGGHLPDDLGPLAIDGVVYLSPVGTHPVSFPNLFHDLCRLLPEDTSQRLQTRYCDPHENKNPRALMLTLLEAFPTGRTIVLLDNFEDVIDPRTFNITAAALDAALRALLDAPEHGVKVILTTRTAPRDLALEQPGRQRRIDLDEGLPSPYAENLLRAMDRDGKLGLKTAPQALLAAARQRTRGYPRALEALVAILAADRDTTLPELLAEEDRLLPGNVVEVLVGEAFNRLDPQAQQVMQALAVYGCPVPPVAVDYLLQPYRIAVDSAPVLARLVNMQFVRRDTGRYSLHQVDREYALSRIPQGQPSDRDTDPLPFTQYALCHRGADYFKQTRAPRETWKTLDNLSPQLAEFELRCQGEEYDIAATILLEIDFDCLMLWGHYRLIVKLHQRLQGRLADPWAEAASKNSLGNCYHRLGQIREAINHHEQALVIARDIGDRKSEANHLGNLGLCYADLGQIHEAIKHYGQALVIAQDIGDHKGEASHLGQPGSVLRRPWADPRSHRSSQASTCDRSRHR